MPVVWTAPIMRPSQLRSRRMKAAHAVSGSRRVTVAIASDLGVSMGGASVAISVPFDLGREAAARSIVGMDHRDVGVLEQLPQIRIRVSGLGQECLGNHPVPVEAAKRQHSGFEHGRYFIDKFGGFFDTLRDEDRMAGP